MPQWLIDILVKLALQFGIPYLIAFISRVPWLKRLLPANFVEIIEEFLRGLGAQKVQAMNRIKSECLGVACAPQLVSKGKKNANKSVRV